MSAVAEPLCRLDDFGDGASRGFSIADGDARLELFVVRRGDEFFGYRNSCPHTGVPLDWLPDAFLDTSGEYIQCATHGALFRIEDGYCVLGPCAGRSLRPVPLRVRDGVLFVDEAVSVTP